MCTLCSPSLLIAATTAAAVTVVGAVVGTAATITVISATTTTIAVAVAAAACTHVCAPSHWPGWCASAAWLLSLELHCKSIISFWYDCDVLTFV